MTVTAEAPAGKAGAALTPVQVMLGAAQVMRERGGALGVWLDEDGRVDAAAAVCIAAGVALDDIMRPQGQRGSIHPRFADDEQAGLAWEALCLLASQVDPGFRRGTPVKVRDEPRLELVETVIGQWSDRLGTAEKVARGLELAAAKASGRTVAAVRQGRVAGPL
jgi:hypothetical protein